MRALATLPLLLLLAACAGPQYAVELQNASPATLEVSITSSASTDPLAKATVSPGGYASLGPETVPLAETAVLRIAVAEDPDAPPIRKTLARGRTSAIVEPEGESLRRVSLRILDHGGSLGWVSISGE